MAQGAYEAFLSEPEPRTSFDQLPRQEQEELWQHIFRIEADPSVDGVERGPGRVDRCVLRNWRLP